MGLAVDIIISLAAMGVLSIAVWYAVVGRDTDPDSLFVSSGNRIDGAEKCPWCNCDSLDVHLWENGVTAVACNFCDCEGPTAATRDQAIMLWNTRVKI